MAEHLIVVQCRCMDMNKHVTCSCGWKGRKGDFPRHAAEEAPVSETTDRNDPRLSRGADQAGPVPQNEAYLVLPAEERAQGHIRPVRRKYVHARPTATPRCGTVTTMSQALAETYAVNPKFYGATYCVGCSMHRPVAEFDWDPEGGEVIPAEFLPVGS